MDSVKRFEEHFRKCKAYRYALSLLSYDGETEGPKKAVDERADAMGVLGLDYFLYTTSKEYEDIIIVLEKDYAKLTPEYQRIVKLARKQIDLSKKIPPQEYEEYTILCSKSNEVWKVAKEKNDFKMVEPYLEKIVAFNQKFATYYGEIDGNTFNSLLDQYEEGITIKKLDVFFDELRKRIVPLVKQVQNSKVKIRTDFNERNYEHDAQLKLGRYVTELNGYDYSRGMLKETEHPFTNEVSTNDIRITTHVYPNNLFSNLFSCAHEGGHAIYDQSHADKIKGTALDDGASLAIHESQSRFYENMISRNENYLNYIYPKVVELFPNQMKDVTPHEFYLAANAVSPSFIRTEADELTYCLHIMVRYELEKDLMSGKLKVKDIPTAWNKKYQEYLGITPPTDTLGCLQDTHWYGGSIGYFFSYALGNAYSGQILHAMQQDINIDAELKKGNLKAIKDWLYEHVHKYGALYAPQELIKLATKEEFTPKYYCDYLEKKFKKIYQL